MKLQFTVLCLLVVMLDRGGITATRFYTAAEVARHNTPEDFWMIIHNKVYDLTSFLIEHPGGQEVLLELGGTDGSDAFEDVGHSTNTRLFMEKLLIGELGSKKLAVKG